MATSVSNNTFSYYTSAIAATADAMHKSGAFMDVISKANPLLERLRSKAKISVDGGRQVAINLMYSIDGNVNSYSDLDELDITRPDGLTTVFDKWAQYHFAVVVSGHEMRTNRGKAQAANLLKARFKQRMLSAQERLASDMWYLGTSGSTATGNNDKNIKSIPILVPVHDSGASAKKDIDLYGIDMSANAYWQPQNYDFATSATAEQLQNGLRKLFLDCAKQGAGEPDLAVTDYQTYNLYLSALNPQLRYTSWEKADIGFKGVELMGATLFPDRFVPDADTGVQSGDGSWAYGTLYFLNTDRLGFMILAGADFKPDSPEKPVNQDAIVTNHFFEGQLILDHRSCHGAAFGIPASLT